MVIQRLGLTPHNRLSTRNTNSTLVQSEDFFITTQLPACLLYLVLCSKEKIRTVEMKQVTNKTDIYQPMPKTQQKLVKER